MKQQALDFKAKEEKRGLPAGWRWVRLGEVCTIHPGQHILESDYNENSIGIGYLTGPADFGDQFPHISKWTKKPKAWSKPGDVLITVKGAGVGKTNFAPETEVAIGRQIMAIRPIEGTLERCFLLNFIRTYFSRLQAKAMGSTVPGLTRDNIESLLIPLPPLAEQRRLAAILQEQLAAVERARAAAQAQLEVAKALPAAYLREVFNSPEAKGWPRRPLGEVCEITARQVDPKIPEFGSLPHVNGENIEGGMCRLTYLKTASENGMTSGKYLFEPGDVLYSKLRPYLRKAVVAEFRGVCSADMYPIRVNRIFLDPHYLGWMLLSDKFTKYADEESRRARMPKLNREQIFSWAAPIPPLSEQLSLVASIAEKITGTGKLLNAIEKELLEINALPAALLRRAFNGEL